MGAAAIAARVRLPRTERGSIATSTLAFHERGGPLVAICGLTGGAGTSTLALLLARAAAAASAVPILLAEADPRHAGLFVVAGRSTPHALLALAHELAEGRTPTDTFVELDPGLRLIAAKPQMTPAVDSAALGALLNQARDAHGLVVIDCGTSWTADTAVLADATHLLWTIPATPRGLAAGEAQLEVAPSPGRAREVLAATAIAPRLRVPVRALRKLARRRCEQLVLLPHDHALAHGEQAASDAAIRAITAMAPILRRRQ